MGILVLAVLLGMLPAAVAHQKGRNFFLWWIYGAALFIVAMPHAIVMKPLEPETTPARPAPSPLAAPVPAPADEMKVCPQCAESVKAAAQICRYCRYEFPPPPPVKSKLPRVSLQAHFGGPGEALDAFLGRVAVLEAAGYSFQPEVGGRFEIHRGTDRAWVETTYTIVEFVRRIEALAAKLEAETAARPEDRGAAI